MANVNSNHTTEAQMIAEASKLGTAYGEGKDAWPMLFQKFASWGQEGVITSATEDKVKGTADKVKARVADFIKAAGKAQTLEQSTITNKETEMRNAVKLGEYCATVKVDPTKLLVNVRDALVANRTAKKPVKSMQTLNAFSAIAVKFREKKMTKLLTTAELQTMVKVAPTTPSSVIEIWRKEAKTLGLLTGLIEPKTASEKRAFAKKDTDENSVKVAAAVIAYVNKLASATKPAKAETKAAKPTPKAAAKGKVNGNGKEARA